MEAPKVLPWYRIYCVALTVLYVIVAALGVAAILLRHHLADSNNPPEGFLVMGSLFLVLGIPLALAFGVAPFLPLRPWAWIYHLVLICGGMTSACCIPVCVPLLIFWIKPETRAHFGRT